ncbi:ABC transporter [Actinorhabdospora filicis]|uniref:ABC transporter n=1 Tax=Actinorhabdospora filicis TaxID=1785913 RepID=A0A9W6SRT7_9ACTN|nr:YhgE/Pip domain-containing protein [Actinorhabdospora filicis]GLZ80923.1 ABC transporter [Actinorhabdospora filicis]
MKALRLALLEFRRFSQPVMRKLALGMIVFVPLLYGSLYLWSNWDPYGGLDKVPVAVVNEDQPATVDGKQLNAGDEFVAQLKATPIFKWEFVDADEAKKGMESGEYYFSITVPSDFSAKLASLAGQSPERASIDITLDDANGFIIGMMAETVKSQLQNQINTAAYTTFATTMFGSLGELHTGLADAANGASQLASGSAAASDGAHKLADGLGTLDNGSSQVATGAQQVSDGANQLNGAVQPIAKFAQDALPGVQDSMASAAEVSGTIDTDINRVKDLACKQDPDGEICSRLTGIAGRADNVNGTIQGANKTIQSLSPGQIGDAAGKVQQLTDGAKQVADGARQVNEGVGTAKTGADQLAAGTDQLKTGSSQLSSGLASAVSKLPSGDSADNAAKADVLGSPVGVNTTNEHPAGVYGRGLAPFFFAIALWVFGLVAFLLLRTFNARAAAAKVNAFTVALGGWLPAGLLGIAGGLVLYVVVDVGLGLKPVNVLGTIGMVVLGVMCFSAIAHFLRLALDAVGDVLILVLLMLQLTACGGLYPIETAPAFFRAIHPFLPMTYFVDALRVTISGGVGWHVARDAAILGAIFLIAVGASTLTVHAQRRWNMMRLKPAVEM